MDKFFELLVPDLSQLRLSGTTPPGRDEIRSPSFDFPRSNSIENSSLIHEMLDEDPDTEDTPPIELLGDTQAEDESSSTALSFSPVKKQGHHHYSNFASKNLYAATDVNNSAALEKDKSNSSSLCGILEEFEICPIHRGTVHSSPKLVTSHFEDSGFLNCSIEMPSRISSGTSSQLQNSFGRSSSRQSEDFSSNHRVLFDSHLEVGGGDDDDDHDDNYSSILEDENPEKCSSRDKPAYDKLSGSKTNDRETWPAQNRSTMVASDECERDASLEKSTHVISANKKSTSSVYNSSSICANNVSFQTKGNCIIFGGANSDAIHRSETSKPPRSRGAAFNKIANNDTKVFECLTASTASEKVDDYRLVNDSADISVIESVDVKLPRNRKKIADIMIFK